MAAHAVCGTGRARGARGAPATPLRDSLAYTVIGVQCLLLLPIVLLQPRLQPPQVSGLLASYDATRGGGRSKVKGNLHWVSGSTPGALPASAEVRMYDYLFTVDEPGAGGADWEAEINPRSEVILTVRSGSVVCVERTARGGIRLCDGCVVGRQL